MAGRAAAAAVLYFLIVFGAGFALGPIRVLWLEPALGETLATLGEAPFLLAAIVLAARAVPRRLGLSGRPIALLATGFGALALQQLADFGTGRFLRGLTLAEQIAQLARPAGRIYLALLVAFALAPLLVDRRPRRKRA